MVEKDAIFRPTGRNVIKMPLIRTYRSQTIGMVDDSNIDEKAKEHLTKIRSGARVFRVEEASLLSKTIS
jgi:hypothetical protein